MSCHINRNLFQDGVSRYLISILYDICESENDADGLKGLRRIMVCYFLNSTKGDSKYAAFTMFDLVTELSESEFMRKR